jgi:hypothetical protein
VAVEILQGSESVLTDTTAMLRRVCDFCGGPIDVPARRRIRTRRFCATRCRMDWHRDHRAALQAEAAALLRRTLAIIDELAGPKR